ncbi:MAG: hypothetical protein QG640_200 [Patescibacteria group bacterium]|nr:hypothetical protein [Patescibacteria group bacterium]
MKICYFGIYNSDFSRNRIYIEALKSAGHSIVECQDSSRGISKYFRLWKKYKALKGDYDVMIVGYPGHSVVPFAKLLSDKKVIADALGSLYDAEVNSHTPSLMRKIKSLLIDRFMVMSADKIMLESGQQKDFFENRFGKSEKYEIVYTGADERMFLRNPLQAPQKPENFLVLFRGSLTPESGIMTVLEAAELLKSDKDIRFRIIGTGYFLRAVQDFIASRDLQNVEFISHKLSKEELVERMLDAHIMLGQFEDNPRLNRTIPHKAFEAFALGIPYLTGEAPAIKEIANNRVTVFFVPLKNSEELAKIIKELASDAGTLQKVAENAQKLFVERFSYKQIAQKIESLI